jgi:uncharacterized protein YxjI
MNDQPKPTRYIIQDKHFALNDKFVITDDSGTVHYTVDSTLFSMGDKLILYDHFGNELIKIRQENLHLHPTYNIYSVRRDTDEMHLASIKRTGAPWNHKLEISATNGEYLMERKDGILSHEFILTKDGVIVAIVTKDTAPSTSIYWVDIAGDREEYRAFLMAMVIVLSCAQFLPGNFVSKPHGDYIKM